MKSAILSIIPTITLCLLPAIAPAAVLSLTPADETLSEGAAFSVDIMISDVGQAVGAFDLNLTYDADSLSFENYWLSDKLGSLNFFEAIDISFGASSGAINIAEVSFLSGAELAALQMENFVIASLNFTLDSLAVGSSTLISFENSNILSDQFGSPINITDFRNAKITSTSSPIKVSEPETLFILITGIFALILRRNIKNRT